MLRYRRHARTQMRRRKITEREVEACWNDHYAEYSDKKGNPIYIADVEGRRIKVVVQKEDNSVVITTGD